MQTRCVCRPGVYVDQVCMWTRCVCRPGEEVWTLAAIPREQEMENQDNDWSTGEASEDSSQPETDHPD